MQLSRSAVTGATGAPTRPSRCIAVANLHRPIQQQFRHGNSRPVSTQATTDSKSDKKILRREEEPEEYWVSKSERKGANPLSDPLAIIGLTAIFLPFVLLGIAIATGLVDLSVYR